MATVALLAIGLATAGYSAYSAHETKQDQEAALEESKAIATQDLADKKKKVIAQQRASFLASGISLTSKSVDVFKKDTEVASQADSNRLSNYYDTQMANVSGQARSSYINALSSAVGSAGSYYSAGVGTTNQTNTSSGVDFSGGNTGGLSWSDT